MALRKPTVELGKKYRDKITGFEGTATAQINFLHGCTRWTLTANKDGEPKEFTFDEPSLEPVETPKPIRPNQRTGGERPSPPRSGL